MKILLVLGGLVAGPAFAESPNVPNRAARLHYFEQTGLATQVSGLDELDQDLLYLRAHTQPLTALQKLYPRLNFSGLTSAKEAK